MAVTFLPITNKFIILEMMANQFQGLEKAFFNVAKLNIPERNSQRHKNSSQFLIKPIEKKPGTQHKNFYKYQKQHAKLELPVMKQKTLRSTAKTIQTQEAGVTSHKKITNLSKYNQQQNSSGQEDHKGVEKIERTQLLNLGLKKKQKGKMKEYMMSILARTKIDDEITIKRSPFQSDFHSNEHRSPRISSLDHKKANAEESQRHTGPLIERKVYSQNKIKALKNIKNSQKEAGDKKEEIKLPNVHEHRSLVQMVKEDEKRKEKLREVRRNKQEEGEESDGGQMKSGEKWGRKKAEMMRNIQNEAIPEQIQYSSNQEREEGEISEQIGSSKPN